MLHTTVMVLDTCTYSPHLFNLHDTCPHTLHASMKYCFEKNCPYCPVSKYKCENVKV